ncbi:MAG TPA: GFA family protein [Povalibacter sp.]
MTIREASCSCGQLRATVSGEAIRISVCHCFACQKRTGSIFGAQARFRREDVSIQGNSREYTRTADSDRTITFSFCPTCGATVHYRQDYAPDVIAIPVGAFADAAFPAPAFSVYESRQHHWIEIRAAVERSD